MQRLAVLLCFYLLIGMTIHAQVTLRLVATPPFYTPLIDPIHVAGTFNSWDPGLATGQMAKQPDGTYTFTINGTSGQTVEYKYARGNWDRVETQLNGTFRPNRTFTFQNGLTITDTVQNWQDLLGWHTAVGNTHILTMDFAIPQFNRTRRIWVYLPQDYYTTQDSFPVLYMHDGQNLFDAVTTAFGTEWAIDEAMEMLQDSGYIPAIIVGIDNGGMDRIAEYTPWVHQQYGGGDGELYMSWVVNNLKPFIDNYFRTRSDRAHTGLMGSSLGGLISLYGGLQYPSTFSKLGVFSPSFWYSDSCYQQVRTQGHQQPMRIYLLAGGQESSGMVPDMLKMEDTLLANGFSTAELRTIVKQDGQHSEWFWAREFPEAFKWLFAETATTTPAASIVQRIRIVPSIIEDSFRLHATHTFSGIATITFFDLNGKQVFLAQARAGQVLHPSGLAPTTYLAEIRLDNAVWRQKVVLQ